MDDYVERTLDQVDQEEFLEFVHEILETECGLHVRNQLRRSIQKFFSEYEEAGRHFVGLYKNEEPKAILAVDRVNSDRAVLKWIFVAEGDRKRGLGSHLVDRAVGFAKAAGFDRLVLGTMTQMESAHRLYEKKNFVFKEQVMFWRKPMMIYEKSLRPNGDPSGQTLGVDGNSS
jgi:GNAT superfamily N-acetyltransferase